MAVTHEFEYFKPDSLDEAVKLLSKFGENASVLAGGTDLAVLIKEDVETPEVIVDIKGIGELHKLELRNDNLFIGAGVTFTDVIESSIIKNNFPLILDASKTVASAGIRNRATVVGNICSAVPSADSAPALLCYEADVIVKNSITQRIIPISEWFTGPKQTALQKDEIVTGLSIPLIKERHGACYEKLGRYSGEDLAQACVGILVLENLQYRIAFGAVGPSPKRSHQIEKLLQSKEINGTLPLEIVNIIPNEISPITDIRSTKEYREHMITIMLERGLKKAVSRMRGGDNG